MNEFDILDAIGGVDEALLSRAEHRPVKKLPLRRFAIAVAAVMTLAVSVMAAPLLRELLFPTEPVQITEGGRHIYGDLYRDIDNDEYRIDLQVNSTAPLPAQIEEVRLPLYMIQNNWLVAYGEIDAVYSEGPVHFKWWDRSSSKWVTFEQKCIPEGRTSFSLETYHGAELSRETVTIDNMELIYYTIPSYHNHETWEFYPRETAVYWSDGEYAYHLQSSFDIALEELARIVQSVATVEDVTPYLKDDPNNNGLFIEGPPLDVHRMPTAIPAGFELKVCADNDWHVQWIWENDLGHTIWFSEAHSHLYTDLFTVEQYSNHPGYSQEELQIDGQTVYSIQFSGRRWLLWEDGNYCDHPDVPIPYGHTYDLWWEGDDTVTTGDLLKIMESVVEVEDISPYLTQ